MGASPAVAAGTERQSHWLDVVADPVRLQILRALNQVSDASVSELANRSPASYQTLRRHLEALEAFRVIESSPGVSDGETSGRPAVRFRLAPAVRESISSVFD